MHMNSSATVACLAMASHGITGGYARRLYKVVRLGVVGMDVADAGLT